MSNLQDIHEQIDRLSERRTELWHQLSLAHDPVVRAELKELEARIGELWQEHRVFRATVRFGERDRIIERARKEERLERAA